MSELKDYPATNPGWQKEFDDWLEEYEKTFVAIAPENGLPTYTQHPDILKEWIALKLTKARLLGWNSRPDKTLEEVRAENERLRTVVVKADKLVKRVEEYLGEMGNYGTLLPIERALKDLCNSLSPKGGDR